MFLIKFIDKDKMISYLHYSSETFEDYLVTDNISLGFPFRTKEEAEFVIKQLPIPKNNLKIKPVKIIRLTIEVYQWMILIGNKNRMPRQTLLKNSSKV